MGYLAHSELHTESHEKNDALLCQMINKLFRTRPGIGLVCVRVLIVRLRTVTTSHGMGTRKKIITWPISLSHLDSRLEVCVNLWK